MTIDRRVLAGLFTITLVCWLWIVPMSRDMYGAMNGPSAWMMTSTWDATHVALLWAMWAVMMAGMMLPSASPLLLLYAAEARRRPATGDRARAMINVYAMATGYLVVWTAFSIGATLLQRVLSRLLILSPMMEMATPIGGAVVLLLAGAYQLTPLKRACLISCRSPLAFIMQSWRAGTSGALRMGIEHGVYCLGCCWALMLLLFAGGVMNLYVIAALTGLVLIEKLAPFGVHTSRMIGVVLVVLGVRLMVR
jgi:predicted metal-binding membrane protein